MHGPPLTRPEVAAILRCGVDRLISEGLGHQAALRSVARRHGVKPKQVSDLIAQADSATGGGLQ